MPTIIEQVKNIVCPEKTTQDRQMNQQSETTSTRFLHIEKKIENT